MTAAKIFDHCTSLGIRLFAASGELGVDAPGCAPSPWLSEELSNSRVELLALVIARDQDARESHRREVEQYADAVTEGRRCPHCHSYDIALIPTAKPPHWAELRCITCEKFVGWAPMPLELAGEWEYPFEPYRKMTLAAIAAIDVEFLQQTALSTRKPRHREMIKFYLEHIYGKPRPPAGAASQPAASVVVADDGDEIPF